MRQSNVVAGTTGLFVDGQGTFDAGEGVSKLPQLPLDGTQVDQGRGDLGMIGTVDLLLDGQGTFDAGEGVPKLPQLLLDKAITAAW